MIGDRRNLIFYVILAIVKTKNFYQLDLISMINYSIGIDIITCLL